MPDVGGIEIARFADAIAGFWERQRSLQEERERRKQERREARPRKPK